MRLRGLHDAVAQSPRAAGPANEARRSAEVRVRPASCRCNNARGPVRAVGTVYPTVCVVLVAMPHGGRDGTARRVGRTLSASGLSPGLRFLRRAVPGPGRDARDASAPPHRALVPGGSATGSRQRSSRGARPGRDLELRQLLQPEAQRDQHDGHVVQRHPQPGLASRRKRGSSSAPPIMPSAVGGAGSRAAAPRPSARQVALVEPRRRLAEHARQVRRGTLQRRFGRALRCQGRAAQAQLADPAVAACGSSRTQSQPSTASRSSGRSSRCARSRSSAMSADTLRRPGRRHRQLAAQPRDVDQRALQNSSSPCERGQTV